MSPLMGVTPGWSWRAICRRPRWTPSSANSASTPPRAPEETAYERGHRCHPRGPRHLVPDQADRDHHQGGRRAVADRRHRLHLLLDQAEDGAEMNKVALFLIAAVGIAAASDRKSV